MPRQRLFIKLMKRFIVSTPARRTSPAACYYMLLSLLPSATILFGVSSYADNLQTHVVTLLQSLIPEPFQQSIFQYLDASLKIRRRLPYSILLSPYQRIIMFGADLDKAGGHIDSLATNFDEEQERRKLKNKTKKNR